MVGARNERHGPCLSAMSKRLVVCLGCMGLNGLSIWPTPSGIDDGSLLNPMSQESDMPTCQTLDVIRLIQNTPWSYRWSQNLTKLANGCYTVERRLSLRFRTWLDQANNKQVAQIDQSQAWTHNSVKGMTGCTGLRTRISQEVISYASRRCQDLGIPCFSTLYSFQLPINLGLFMPCEIRVCKP